MGFLSEADQKELAESANYRGCDQGKRVPELSQRFNVMGVPKTVINATQDLVGAQPEARLMAAMRAAVSTTKEG